MNLTLDMEAMDNGLNEYEGILWKESGDWLERNPYVAEGINAMSLNIICCINMQNARPSSSAKPAKPSKPSAGGKTSATAKTGAESVANNLDDVVNNLDDLANTYDDIYEAQRKVCTEYDDYLDDLVTPKQSGVAETGLKTELEYTTSSGLKLEATSGKTTTILGTYADDTANILDELGNVKSMDFGPKDGNFNLLNTPDEIYNQLGPEGFWEQCNKPWLDNAIDRSDIIKIATEPTYNNLHRVNNLTGEIELTGFGREFEYLESKGYTYDSISKSMIKD